MHQFEYKRFYRRNLPHLQPPGATMFVTFRLDGSLPKDVVERWREERKWLEHLEKTNPSHYLQIKDDFDRTWFKKFELVLDRGDVGPLWLRDRQVADIVADSLHYRDGSEYRLDAFTIMPNHVHTVFKPLPLTESEFTEEPVDVKYHSLASIMQSLKGYTAYQANRALGLQGQFWAHENYDRWIRTNLEWRRTIAYTLNNPIKSRFVKRWQDWKWSYSRSRRDL